MTRYFFSNIHKASLAMPFLAFFGFGYSRGVGNSLLYLYLLVFTVYVWRKSEFCFSKVTIGWFLFATYLVLSALLYHQNLSSLKYALTFSFMNFAAVLVLSTVFENDVEQRIRGLLPILLIPIILFLYKVSFCSIESSCRFATNISGYFIVLAFPILGLCLKLRGQLNIWYFALACSGLLVILTTLDNATEVLIFLIQGIAIWFFLKRKFFWVIPSCLILLILTIAIDSLMTGRVFVGNDMQQLLSNVSSLRTDIWLNAFSNPPDNSWLGVGVRQITKHISFYHGHLHNIVLDLWFEIGLIGIFVYGSWILIFLLPFRRVYLSEDSDARTAYAVLSGVLVAVAISLLIDVRYYSPLGGFFLPCLLSLMLIFSRKVLSVKK